MGREVRKVPPDWEHPKALDGAYQPLHDRDYEFEAREWMENAVLWAKGEHPDQNDQWGKDRNVKERHKFYWDWAGQPPDKAYHRPAWAEETRTCIQMYETCSEGTPISPVMETPEELARWLTDNGASAFGSHTATYEQWLVMIGEGWAPSAMFTPGKGLISGVAATAEKFHA